MGGGIGGGSSNAATTLLALNYLWQTHLSIDELAELGLKLGADVPIFVHGQAAFAEGVGEKFNTANHKEKYYVVLKPETAISTAVVFSAPNLPRNTEKIPCRTFESTVCKRLRKVVRTQYPEVEKPYYGCYNMHQPD